MVFQEFFEKYVFWTQTVFGGVQALIFFVAGTAIFASTTWHDQNIRFYFECKSGVSFDKNHCLQSYQEATFFPLQIGLAVPCVCYLTPLLTWLISGVITKVLFLKYVKSGADHKLNLICHIDVLYFAWLFIRLVFFLTMAVCFLFYHYQWNVNSKHICILSPTSKNTIGNTTCTYSRAFERTIINKANFSINVIFFVLAFLELIYLCYEKFVGSESQSDEEKGCNRCMNFAEHHLIWLKHEDSKEEKKHEDSKEENKTLIGKTYETSFSDTEQQPSSSAILNYASQPEESASKNNASDSCAVSTKQTISKLSKSPIQKEDQTLATPSDGDSFDANSNQSIQEAATLKHEVLVHPAPNSTPAQESSVNLSSHDTNAASWSQVDSATTSQNTANQNHPAILNSNAASGSPVDSATASQNTANQNHSAILNSNAASWSQVNSATTSQNTANQNHSSILNSNPASWSPVDQFATVNQNPANHNTVRPTANHMSQASQFASDRNTLLHDPVSANARAQFAVPPQAQEATNNNRAAKHKVKVEGGYASIGDFPTMILNGTQQNGQNNGVRRPIDPPPRRTNYGQEEAATQYDVTIQGGIVMVGHQPQMIVNTNDVNQRTASFQQNDIHANTKTKQPEKHAATRNGSHDSWLKDGQSHEMIIPKKALLKVEEIIESDWKKLGDRLGISLKVLNEIEKTNSTIYDRVYEMLRTWINHSYRTPHQKPATLKTLIHALSEIDRQDIVLELI